jgi:hypothetical protein
MLTYDPAEPGGAPVRGEGNPPAVSSNLSVASPRPPHLGLLELSLPFQRMRGSLHWSRLSRHVPDFRTREAQPPKPRLGRQTRH